MGVPYLEAYSTQVTLFFWVYGAETMVSVKVMVPSVRRALASKLSDPNDKIHDMEPLRRGYLMRKQVVVQLKIDHQSLQ